MLTSEQIKKAMLNFTPVKYEGIVYKRISAYIYRVIRSKHNDTYKTIYQVELLDKNEHSVVIADPQKVELIENEYIASN